MSDYAQCLLSLPYKEDKYVSLFQQELGLEIVVFKEGDDSRILSLINDDITENLNLPEVQLVVKELTRLYDDGNALIPDAMYTHTFKGANHLEDYASHKHLVPMAGIPYTTSKGKVAEFLKKMETEFLMGWTPKLDGVALSIEGKIGINGKMYVERILTRGDGERGNEIQNYPEGWEKHKGVVKGNDFIVRGELVIQDSSFKILNESRVANGDKPYKIPRGVAAAAAREKKCENPLIEWCTFISYWSWGVPITIKLSYARVPVFTGFQFDQGVMDKFFNTYNDYIGAPTDGIVIAPIRDTHKGIREGLQSEMMLAFKPPELVITAEVVEVIYQKGRTDVLTPVIVINPVDMYGKTVSKVSGFNYSVIKEDVVSKGGTIDITLSGEVTPTYVRGSAKGGDPQMVRYPKCPECNSHGVPTSGRNYSCMMSSCSGELPQAKHFYHVLGVKGVGPEILRNFMENYKEPWWDFDAILMSDLVNTQMAKDHLDDLPHKDIECWRVIEALGIKGVAKATAKKLEDLCAGDIENLLQDLQYSDGEEIGWIGERYDNLIASVEEVMPIIHHVAENLIITYQDVESALLQDEKVVVTGSFNGYKRTDIEALVQKHGGSSTSAISSRTTLLVVGNNPGSKLKKAQQLGTEMVTLDEFLAMIEE